MPKGYFIAQVDVTNPTQYAGYRSLAELAVAHYGGTFLARGGRMQTVEGDGARGSRMVVTEFPSFDQAQAFYDSPEYAKARAARAGAATFHGLVLEGV